METITFRCGTCQMVLKVGADKAGRTAKCSKCGTPLTIPAKSEKPQAPAPPPKPAASGFDDDDGGAYGVQDVPSAEEQQRQKEIEPSAPALKGPGREKTKKQAKITNPDEWRKVGLGAKVIGVGLCMWLAANLLYYIPVIQGLVAGEEYAAAANEPLGSGVNTGKVDLLTYAVGVLAGSSGTGLKLTLVRLSQIVHLLAWIVLLVGYFMCLAAPNRFGIRLQLMVLIGLAFVNTACLIGFKLLPVFGVSSYVLLPFVFPEMTLVEMNADRLESVFTFWLKYPLLESYATILLTVMLYLEPALIATFVCAVGKSIRAEELESEGFSNMMFGYSQLYIQTTWYMAAICGSSNVLLWILRTVYTLGAMFFCIQLVKTSMALFSISANVEKQLGDEAASPKDDDDTENNTDEEEEDEEEEEEDEEEE